MPESFHLVIEPNQVDPSLAIGCEAWKNRHTADTLTIWYDSKWMPPIRTSFFGLQSKLKDEPVKFDDIRKIAPDFTCNPTTARTEISKLAAEIVSKMGGRTMGLADLPIVSKL